MARQKLLLIRCGELTANNQCKEKAMSLNRMDLNEEQHRAVEATEGPVLILAGAGSGKTRALTYRIAYLINELHVNPGSVLAVTFTNKAAKEMRGRIEQLIHTPVATLWIGTFHGICARILRTESERIGFSRNFTIYDVDDQVRAIKKVISSLGVPQQVYAPKMIQNRISKMKNLMISFAQLKEMEAEDGLSEFMPDIYREYHKYITANNAMDFDDLLLKPIELFEKYPDILKKYTRKFRYVLVDEYQDTNRAQYLFIKKIVEEHRNICVVGDEDQSIYGWRGADISNILNFNKDFREARVFKLEENYRSNNNILKAANALVKNNKERLGKTLWTKRIDGEKIKLYRAEDDEDEARYIIECIHDEMYTNKRSFKDIAILYRTNSQSRVIEDVLRRNAINYIIVGGVKFYERKEIKDLLAYLRVIDNPADSISLKRIINFPLRGIGETTVSRIEKFSEIEGCLLFDAMGRVAEVSAISPTMGARVMEFYNLINKFIGLKTELSAAELAAALASETGIMHHYQTEYDPYESESRVANIKELFNSIEYFCRERARDKRDNSLSVFLEEVSLMTDVDSWNSAANSVSLMTLHSAKGLEFPVVIIAGVEMGLIPLLRNNGNNSNELEEERRLFYVGMTRAEECLYLSYAKLRRKYNSYVVNASSIFLDELPENLIENAGENGEPISHKRSSTASRRKKVQSYSEDKADNYDDTYHYKVGQPVYHALFGSGQIIDLEGSGDKMKVTVQFKDSEVTKKLIARYANLSPIES